jgi:hypothetical protein
MLHGCPAGRCDRIEEIAPAPCGKASIYAIDGAGHVDYLPAEEPAAEHLLFPDLGRGVRYSAAQWGDGKVTEWCRRTCLKLSGCQE